MAAKRVVREIPCINILQVSETSKKLKQVAAYARVSTEKEQQEDSFERQVDHYTQLINNNPEWQMVEVYADPGISGTRAEKRPSFMRMIEDCRAGKIEKILVKSISRFARNTVDALQYIRELKDLNISVYFENENIDTLTSGGDVLLTILAAIAEQESRTISTNIRWAYQRKFQNGDIILNTGLMLGYTRLPEDDENGTGVYEINEEEAAVVRRIFTEYIAGVTITRICRGLEADGIPTKLGKTKWRTSVIESILTNEKYTGNAILGKTYKQDVLTKYRKKNDGTMAPMYYAENTHPAIIEPAMFELAKKEMEHRKAAKDETVGTSRYSSKYPFSGMLVCGTCGSRLRRHVRTMGAGNKVASWACSNRVENGRSECDSHHVREDVMEATYKAAINSLTKNMDVVIKAVTKGAMLSMQPKNKDKLEAVEREIVDTQEQALALHKRKVAHQITEAEYVEAIQRCSKRIEELEERQKFLQASENRFNEVRAWLDAFSECATRDDVSSNDTVLMKALVERIIVWDDHIEVAFKCGARIEQEYVK